MTWWGWLLLGAVAGGALVALFLRRSSTRSQAPHVPMPAVPDAATVAAREQRDEQVKKEIRDAADADLAAWLNELDDDAARR